MQNSRDRNRGPCPSDRDDIEQITNGGAANDDDASGGGASDASARVRVRVRDASGPLRA